MDIRLWRFRLLRMYHLFLDLTFDAYKLFTGRYQKLKKGEKIRIVFVLSLTPGWNCFFTVYQSFLHMDEIDVLVLASDYLADNASRSPSKYLADHNIDFLEVTKYHCKRHKPHAIFVANHITTNQNHWILRSKARIVYIPYGTSVSADKFSEELQYNLTIHNRAWRIFVAGDFVKDLYGLYCRKGNEHVLPYGHPKTEVIYRAVNDHKKSYILSKQKKRCVILWNIHYDIELKWSTWPEYGIPILNLFSCRDNVSLICRPHPFFFSSFEQSEADRVRNLIVKNKNTILDVSPLMTSSVAECDALITDGSSIIYDFFVTSKPILYLRAPQQGNLARLHKHCFNAIKSHHFIGDNIEKISAFIDMVCNPANQSKGDDKKNILDQLNITHPLGIGSRIAKYVASEIKEESKHAR